MKPRTVKLWAAACLFVLGLCAGTLAFAAAHYPDPHWSDGAFRALHKLEAAWPGDPRVADLRRELETLERRLR